MGANHGNASGGGRVAELAASALGLPALDQMAMRRAVHAAALMKPVRSGGSALKVSFDCGEGYRGYGLLRSDGLGAALTPEDEGGEEPAWRVAMGFGGQVSARETGLFETMALLEALDRPADVAPASEAFGPRGDPWAQAAAELARRPRASADPIAQWTARASPEERRLDHAMAAARPGEIAQGFVLAAQARALESESGACRVEHWWPEGRGGAFATAVGCDGRIARMSNFEPLRWLEPGQADLECLSGAALGFEEWPGME